MQKRILLDITNYQCVLLVQKNSHRCLLFVPQQTALSLTMVLKWFIQWFFVYIKIISLTCSEENDQAD